MIGNVNLDLLEKTYQNASTGITALGEVLNKTKSADLNTALYKQLREYKELEDKAKNELQLNGAKVKNKSAYEKVMLKGSVKMKTFTNSSQSHIAQMVIQGSTMGVTQMTKLLHENNNTIGVGVELAKEFIKKEEENIEAMKKYL